MMGRIQTVSTFIGDLANIVASYSVWLRDETIGDGIDVFDLASGRWYPTLTPPPLPLPLTHPSSIHPARGSTLIAIQNIIGMNQLYYR
jgi:hypothetical protein